MSRSWVRVPLEAQNYIRYQGPFLFTISAFGGDYFFDGILDDFRIYNRALTEQEVSALFNE